MSIEQVNKKFPVGTKVKYYPIMGFDKFSEHEINSEPWELGHGDIVIKVTDKSGGVCVDHLEVIGG
jgi:hypothetical protein